MTDSEDPYDDVIRAADRFADWTYDRLARKVVHAMQRFGATGIFDDGNIARFGTNTATSGISAPMML